ncbi:amino acid adenylation domain-containing protein, partial [Paenibacillus sp. SYP-B3998]|nr:amino acid adenylation domain-containing protein [Paenibacillus sp. SYP-B3998]
MTFERESVFWSEKFDGEDTPTILPYSKAPGSSAVIAQTLSSKLSADVSERIIQMSGGSHLAAYMILLTGVQCLLYKYTNEEHILVGMPAVRNPNRSWLPIDDIVVFKDKVRTDSTFKSLLNALKHSLAEVLNHQSIPFRKMTERLHLRDENGIPVVNTLVSLKELHSVDVNKSVIADIIFKFELEHDSIQLNLMYNENLYSKDFITQTVAHLNHLFAIVLYNPELEIGSVELLSEQEKHQLLHVFNDTAADYPRNQTIHQLFEEQAERNAEALAVVYEDKQWTYRELNERANRLARTLQARGVQAEQLVGILAERSLDMVVGILAILKAGGAYVPIDPEYPEDRIRYMLEDSGAQVLLLQAHLQEKVAFEGAFVLLDDEQSYHKTSSNLTPINQSTDVAYVIYTSGTTGKPKGTLIEHKNVVRLLFNSKNLFDFEASDTWTLFHSFCFDFSVWEMYGALLYGGKLVVVPSLTAKNPAQFLRLLSEQQVTILNQTPTSFYQLLREALAASGAELRIRKVIFGGEALSPQLLKDWRAKYPNTQLINMYGITETTVHVTYKEITEVEIEQAKSNIGYPIPTLRVYVLDANRKNVPMGVAGEMYVAGDGLARGYLHRPDLTAEKFVDNPFEPGERMYRTGDLARWLPDGNIEYLGRIDHQVKIRGYRIELGEVEAQLQKVESVQEALVIARADDDGEKQLCAYFVADRPLTVSELRGTLSQGMPSYMIPSYFVQLVQMPLTSNGKVDRKALPAPESSVNTGATYTAPRTPLEVKLVRIWQEVLGLEKVGVKDNFFDLGGHSLRATTLVSKVHQELNVDLSLRDVFRFSKIEELAQLISGMEQQAYSEIPLAEESDCYQVSSAQKRLYILHQLEGAEQSYNMPGVMMLEGDLNRARFEEAFQSLIARHETLRTGFEMVNGEPVQQIQREVSFAVAYMQASAQEAGEVVRRFVQAFNLAKPPLLRVGLIELTKERHILMLDMHHIISDGVSMGILVEEFVRFYSGEELPPLRIQYKDYAAWQLSEVQKNQMQQQEAYWLDKFSGELPVLEMPTDDVRPAVQSYDGNTLQFFIEPQMSEGLNRIATETGSTLYMVLLAAYTILLHKYTGQEDVIVGTPIAGRTHGDLQPLIGMFVGTLAIRNYPANEKTFLSYLKEVKETTLGAYEHQNYPFEELVEKLQVVRDLSRNPLFDTMLTLQNTESKELRLEGLELKPYPTEQKVAKFDLSLDVTEGHDGLVCSLEYATALYQRQTVERIAKHFQQLLTAIVDAPEAAIATFDMLTVEEKEQIQFAFNATETEYPREKMIHQLFEEQVERTPEATAIVFGDKLLTYRELNERANRLARTLRAQGVKPDQLVGIMTERSVEMIVGIIAILKSGGAYVPVDSDYPTERIRYMLEDSGAQVLLAQRHLQERVTFAGEWVALDDEESYSEDGSNLALINKPTHLMYVIYTSGTTGNPKGVMVSHQNVWGYVNSFIEKFGINFKDRILHQASISFDTSVEELYPALLTGASIVVVSKEEVMDVRTLSQEIKDKKVTVISCSPLLLNELNHSLGVGHRVRLFISGGDVLRRGHYANLHAAEVYNTYGPTEGTVCATYYRCKHDEASVVPIGKPVANKRVYIVNANRQMQPVGVPGEICIAGAGTVQGYLNRPELTAEKFVDNPFEPGERMYRTGDLARWLPDGNIEYLGRIDQQVNIRGYRIELGEVEAQVLKIASVKEAVVIAREDEASQKSLCAYFVADSELTVGELRDTLSQELPGYMIPSYFMQIAQMPLTSNGKLDRKALPAPEGSASTGGEYVAPRNETERTLATVWQAVLGSERIGVMDHFFELGGDSIKSIQVSSRLHQAGYKLEIRDLFKYPTIAQLVSHVQPVARIADQGEVTGEVTLTPILKWFFEQPLADPHHFNQSVMLHRKEGFDETAIHKVMRKVTEHHDALRMVFRMADNGGYIGWNRGIAEGQLYSLEVVDFRGEAKLEQAIEAKVNEIQSRMNLETGPLVNAGLFQCADGDHLLIVIHHSVIDGVSWRILLEDIASGYEQAVQGEEIRLPAKTDAYRIWSEQLAAYAQSTAIADERAYWERIGQIDTKSLPKDLETEYSLQQDSESIVIQWSSKETEQLLKQVHRAYNTEMNDILLAALGMAVQKWSGHDRVLVNLEGHGRESILTDIDITRTVGWFTSQYPVMLEMEPDRNLSYQIKKVKEELRQVPNKGIGYGISRYLSEHTDEAVWSAAPEISFNYLGQFDQDLQNNELGISSYSSGSDASSRQLRQYALDINGMITEGSLSMDLSYSKREYRRETIEKLAGWLQESIQAIIRHCAAKERSELTPSDVLLKGLSLEELDRIAERTRHIGEVENIYMLTPMQKGMWFHSAMDGHAGAYFEQTRFTLQGMLDVEQFANSWRALAARHAVLRTNFYRDSSGEPMQIVYRDKRIGFAYEDLRDMQENEREASVEHLVKADKARGFDLEQDELMRVTVVHIEEESYLVLWSSHHILMDGWCMPQLTQELLEMYAAYVRGDHLEQTAAPSYSQYIQWMEKQDGKAASMYWNKYLAGYEGQIALPQGKAQGQGEDKPYVREHVVCDLGKPLSGRMSRLAKQHQVTLNTLMQAAWGVLLQKYNGTGDAVFGGVVSGRPAEIPGIEEMVGLFINTIPIRVTCNPEASFAEVMGKLQQQALDSGSYDYYPLYEIQAQSAQKQNLINHIMVFENYPVEEQMERSGGQDGSSNLVITDVQVAEQTNYDFNLIVMPGEEIVIRFDYNAQVFDRTSIERVKGHLVNVLEQIVANSQVAVGELELTTAAEKDEIMHAFNDTAADYPRNQTIHQLFEEQAERNAEALAVVYEDKQWTYRELNERANGLARTLRARGVQAEQLVGILAERSLDMVVGILAILKAGGAYVPIDPEYPEDRIRYMLEDSGAQVLLLQAHLQEKVAFEGAFVLLDDEQSYHKTSSNLTPINQSTDVAYVIYTS